MKQEAELFDFLPAPAIRALKGAGILSFKKLSNWTEASLLELHGFGPGSIPKLKKKMKSLGLELKKSNSVNSAEVEAYHHRQSDEVRKRLDVIRKLIRKLAPLAVEMISYGMPGYKLNNRPLVYYAAFKNHVGFYPTGSGIEFVKNELINFKWAKGSIQFPNDQALPLKLIKKIVTFRIRENNSIKK
jgi:uncharacterized protein YdhG (YjbR/CyaY superfamily)